MAPMFQGFPVHAGSVRSLVQRPERSGGGGGGGGGDLREARQSLYGLHRPQRSFVRCFLISVFNLAPLLLCLSYASASASSSFFLVPQLLLILLSLLI